MKIGTCVSMKTLTESFSQADYVEIPARDLFALEKSRFDSLQAAVEAGWLNAYSCNCLTPKELRLTGPEADMAAIEAFCNVVFERLAALRVKLVVFGAGPSKSVPEGFSREKAWEQLYELGRMLAQKAAQYGQIIAVEPLSYGETNIINMVEEAVSYVETVNLPNFRYMVDFFHFDNNGQKAAALLENSKGLIHAHIAAPKTRTVPQSPEDWTFVRNCMELLKAMNYTGGLSFEGKSNSPEEINAALAVMKKFL